MIEQTAIGCLLWHFGATIEAAEQCTREARKVADLAACEAWNIRMKGYGGPAQPSPLLGDALNAGYPISK